MCVGSHLAVYRKYCALSLAVLSCSGYADCEECAADALAEMKYIVAALYSNYSTTIIDDTGIEQMDSYTAPPKSEKLLIRLEELAM